MDRDVDTNQKRGKASKAKLDSKGRPIAVQAAAPAPEPDPEQGERADGAKPVRVAVRLGVLLFALSTQSGCEPEPIAEPEPLPAVADTGLEAAIADARAAAEDARKSSELSHGSAMSASKSAEQCLALAVIANPSKFASAHGAKP